MRHHFSKGARDRLKYWFVVATVLLLPVCHAQQSVDQGVSDITSKMGRVLVGKGKTKLAVSDFSDLEGRPTEFGRFVAEQLSVEFVNTQGISVVDRANLKSILAEHKLSEDGLINPDTAKKLGQFAGVDVIVIGTITQLDDNFIVTAKAIATDTAEIVAAAKATVTRTRDSQQLVSRAVGRPGQPSPESGKPQQIALASKNLGDLSFAVLRIARGTVSDRFPRHALRCVLELTNRNIREPLMLALNGQKRYADSAETYIRTRIVDARGKGWLVSALQGISFVRVGGNISPSAIAATVAYGQKGDPQQRFAVPGTTTWLGDFTTIPPGEAVQVSVTFLEERVDINRPPPEGDVQFECEVVAGIGAQALKKLRLYNVLFSDIKL